MNNSEKALLDILRNISCDLEAIECMMDDPESDSHNLEAIECMMDDPESDSLDVVQEADTDIAAWIATVESDDVACQKVPIVCADCGIEFRHISSRNRHIKESRRCIRIRQSRGEAVESKEFTCEHCQMTFTRSWDRSRHISQFH